MKSPFRLCEIDLEDEQALFPQRIVVELYDDSIALFYEEDIANGLRSSGNSPRWTIHYPKMIIPLPFVARVAYILNQAIKFDLMK